jgi:hypothetical protein
MNSPATGSTCACDARKLTAATVREKIANSDRMFVEAEDD